MYYVYKHTKSATYDECISGVFGKKVGLFSNFVVFIHVFGSVVSTWIFSYFFCLTSLEEIWGPLSYLTCEIFKFLFFGLTALVMFFSASFAEIDKLKIISFFGFFILIFLVGLCVGITPQYYSHYKNLNQIQLQNVKISEFVFKSYGLTQYIFLNQYSIIPLYNSVGDVSRKSTEKIIFWATLIILVIYLSVMCSGYFSQPNIEMTAEKLTELFLLRPSIYKDKEILFIFGRALFGITLFIANLIKNHFFLIYFYQIIKNFKDLFGNCKDQNIIPDSITSQDNVQILEKSNLEKYKKNYQEAFEYTNLYSNNGRQELCDKSKNIELTNQTNMISLKNNSPKKLFSCENNENKSKLKIEINFDESNKMHESVSSIQEQINMDSDGISKNRNLKNNKSGNWIINFLVILFTALLTLTLMKSLSTFLSLIGNFVGVFEIVIFPFLSIIIINNSKNIISNLHLVNLIVKIFY